jgi:hypothetical protein
MPPFWDGRVGLPTGDCGGGVGGGAVERASRNADALSRVSRSYTIKDHGSGEQKATAACAWVTPRPQRYVGWLEYRTYLSVWIRVPQKSCPCANRRHPVLNANCSECEASIHRPIKVETADGASVPRTARLFLIFNKLHRPHLQMARWQWTREAKTRALLSRWKKRGAHLWRPGHRDCPRVAEEGVQCIKLGSKLAFHVIHCVNQPRVLFDLPACNDLMIPSVPARDDESVEGLATNTFASDSEILLP